MRLTDDQVADLRDLLVGIRMGLTTDEGNVRIPFADDDIDRVEEWLTHLHDHQTAQRRELARIEELEAAALDRQGDQQ